jgi:hypothetical protein
MLTADDCRRKAHSICGLPKKPPIPIQIKAYAAFPTNGPNSRCR